MGKNFLRSSIQNASFNIISQIGFRVITFVLNAFVLRNVSEAVVGVMYVRLLLLESTILFLSREAFRRACLSKTTDHNWPQVINLIWCTVPLCLVLSGLFGWLWLEVLTPPDTSITPHYSLGVWSIILSCLIEMCVEPIDLVAQAFLFVKLRVLLHCLHILVRTVIFTVIVLRGDSAVLAFSAAQVLSNTVFAVSYVLYFHHYVKNKPSGEDFPFTSLSQFLPQRLSDQGMVDVRLCSLTWSFLKQGVVKQILTEGEKYIMSLFSVLSFKEQGLYDVVNNLGSLAARFVFRPIEENSYFYFSQLIHRDKPIKEQNKEEMREAVTVLEQLLRCLSGFGLTVIGFGQSYSRLLLTLYGGARLGSSTLAVLLLRVHSVSILLLGLNGITEAFAFATMTSAQIDRYNYMMAYLSIGFLFISWLLITSLGSVGFILANCANMATRILHSVRYIRETYKDTEYQPLSGLTPRPLFISTLAFSTLVTLLSQEAFFEESKWTHLGIGVVCFMLTVGSWVYGERSWVMKSSSRLARRLSLKED